MTQGRDRQIKNSGLYLLAVFASFAMPLFTIPFLTRVLTPHDYGILALSSIFGVFLSSLVNFGLVSIYQRDYFKYTGARERAALLYSILVFVCVFFSIIVTLAGFFNAQLSMLVFNQPGLGHVLIWDAFACFFAGLNQYYLFYFQNEQDARKNISWSLASIAGGTFIGLALVIWGKTGFIGLIWAKLISDAFIFIYLTYYFLSHLRFAVDGKLLRTAISQALPLTPNIITKMFMRNGDKYLINLLSSMGQTGIYNIADKFAYISFALMTAFDQVYIPNILSKMFEKKEGVSREIGLYLTPFFYLSIFCCLGTAVLAHEIIWVLTPSDYHGAANIMVVLVMYYSLLFFSKQQQLLFTGKTALMSGINFFNMLTVVGLNIIFIKQWGAIGAAWATFCAGAIFSLVYFIAGQKAYYIAWEYKKICVILFYFMSSAVAVLIFGKQNYYVFLMLKMGICLGYIYIGWKFKIVNRENIKLISNVFLKRFIKS